MYSMQHVLKYVYSAYLGSTKFRVNELVAPDKGYAQLSWHNPSARLYCDIVSLANVVDVDWNGCICPNAILLHLRDQLTLCKIVWCGGLALQSHDTSHGV